MPDKRLFLPLRIVAILSMTLSAMIVWAADQSKETVLFNFNGSDGAAPISSLIMDAAGNLYGTTSSGGVNNIYGTVFELSPASGGGWTETVLHTFDNNGSDGWNPQTNLIFDAHGNLYGTTAMGGTYDYGTVFELSPMPGGGWTETVLYSFRNGTDGAYPVAGLILDDAGNLYGTTSSGGAYSCRSNGGCGTVFELTTASGGWTETIIHSFGNGTDGYAPSAGLIRDAEGNFYGTTPYGGTNHCMIAQYYGCGIAFELSPTEGGGWTETVLHNFGGSLDGTTPAAALIFDATGNLYGTTVGGGAHTYGGTVFELLPAAGGNWTEQVLYSFNEEGSGAYAPFGALLFDAVGDLYGTTIDGGVYNNGISFKLTPSPGGFWTETVLHSFGNGQDAAGPAGSLIFDGDGNLYGTTVFGGTYQCGTMIGCGTVFQLTPVRACTRCSHSEPR